MSDEKTKVDSAVIENFLQGSDPQKYIVAIEADYSKPVVTLVINEPDSEKRLEEHTYKPFLWFKEDAGKLIYGGKRLKRMAAAKHYGVKITKLRTSDDTGYSPSRLENGFKFIATCTGPYKNLINFFKDGGIDIFSNNPINPEDDPEDSLTPKQRSLFVAFSPVEQFLIQTGKRLFRGFDDYDDLHRFQFDLETEGLYANKSGIFQIGMRDNKGFEAVLETIGDDGISKRESERENIAKFFKVIDAVQPDIIAGYNSENFDWPFIFERASRLGMKVEDLSITLNRIAKIKRRPSTLKLGSDTEHYDQTNMWGYNIIDISHAVRRAMAINSEIKGWGLKYITQYSEIAKPNRVYVQGDKINTTWADKVNTYAFNDTDGDWYKITEDKPIREGYVVKKGDYIVQRYLCDDLWETEQIDNIFNQASFLISKMLPTTYMRSSTMGTAGQWKLIMAAWSYENGLAIPEGQRKRDFTGGLSRLLEVGYAKNVVKLDFAALYPKIQLTHLIFPDLDISGMMEGTLTYIVDTRDEFKFKIGIEKKKYKKLESYLSENRENMTKEVIDEHVAEISKFKALANLYDKKQLPLKILANSWFGSYGAPYIFNWGDSNSAEETTCRGRQYLRLMVRHFTEKYGFRPLVGDSVTYDTPVYIRYKTDEKYIDVLPICDLFNEKSEFLDSESLRDFEEKPFEVLTRNGWKDLKYVYRHGTDKNIHRITTKDRLLNVTEDHSLFKNGVEVKPSDLKRFDVIDTYEIPLNNLSTMLTLDKAYLMGFFLGDGSANNSARSQKYVSKKTGKTHINKGKRSDWKISNSRLDLLEKLSGILKNEFNINNSIKDHRKSSGVYNLIVNNSIFTKEYCENFYTSYREKKIPSIILNSNYDIKKSFIEGVFASDGYGDTIEDCSDIGMKSQVAMAGISMLLKELNIDFKIKTRFDKDNFISFNLKNSNRNNSSFTNKTKKKTNEVWKNEIISNKDKNNYVYDISTEDGTFVCGINGIIAHNTDGFNFAFPDNVDDVKYMAKGSHWKTIDDAGKELIGLEAILAEFNEVYMEGRMGLDIDDICRSTINFARKNYANDIDGKIKLVGNSVKSKKMSVFIEEFLGKSIRMLLDGDGHSFINYYYEYVDKIYNYQIPVVKMASKAKVKLSIQGYKDKSKKLNKAGNPLPKQAHMELAMRAELDVNLGDTLYYINTGTSKSHGDLKSMDKIRTTKKEKDDYFKEHGKKLVIDKMVELNCKLIDPKIVENDFENLKEMDILNKALLKLDKTDSAYQEIEVRIKEINDNLYTEEFNVSRYLNAFNKKIKPLLVCFSEEVRGQVLLDIIKTKDKVTKKNSEKLKERTIFTNQECELACGLPYKDSDQDSYEDLMRMEDKEIRFWDSVDKQPNNMELYEWVEVRANYHERMSLAVIEGNEFHKEVMVDIIKHMELVDLLEIVNNNKLPIDIIKIADVAADDNGVYLFSRKWGGELCRYDDLFKYKKEAKDRDEYYKLAKNHNNDNRYEQWLDYVAEREIMTGKTINMDLFTVEKVDISTILPIGVVSLDKIKDNMSTFKLVKVEKVKQGKEDEEGGDDDNEEEVFISDVDGNLIRKDEVLKFDDGVDDTYYGIPEDYDPNEEGIKFDEDDEWGY